MKLATSHPRAGRNLDLLDRQIIAALHVDGRATWRAIAGALRQPERSVARRGRRMLEQRYVTVHGLAEPWRTTKSEPTPILLNCAPGSVPAVAEALAGRRDSVVTHILSGSFDVYADVWSPEERLSRLVLHELAAIPGVVSVQVAPALRYVKTVQHWRPSHLLTDEQVAALREFPLPVQWPEPAPPVRLSREDQLLLDVLADDGRRSYEEVGRICGCSEQTAARRIETMRDSGLLSIRALAHPCTLGLPVGALLRIQAPMERVPDIQQALYESADVRYAVKVLGGFQFIVDVRVPDRTSLSDLLLTSAWLSGTNAVDTSLILQTIKQSGILFSDDPADRTVR